MYPEATLKVPCMWHELPVENWHTPIVMIGATDSGKTSFARYLYERLRVSGESVALVDLDPGQNVFGLPTTAAIGLDPVAGTDATPGLVPPGFPPHRLRKHVFVCGNSPVRHEARVLAALHQLSREARAQGASRVIVDTSGFVDVAHGAADLKWAKIDLLRPCTVVAFQREAELTPIIEPWRYCEDVELVTLPASEYVRQRSREARRAYRTSCYRRHFAKARRIPLHFASVALYASGPWARHQLIALEDAEGYVLALAQIDQISEAVVWITTPWSGSGEVAAIRMGDISLDPETFSEQGYGAHVGQ
jgi:polynucleotide 5'-hydroxyl-kinase GRC3/NOL9